MSYIKKILLIVACAFLAYNSYAQPANDNCSSAEVLTMPGVGGFGIGLVTSTTVDLTGATIQIAEPFHTTMISAGNDKASIWFKFTLPTTRAINVALKQPGIIINEADVGFSVYKSSTCLPALADLAAAKLTTVNKFGSTFNECLTAGDYYIQVGAKSSVASSIFIELTTSYPFTTVNYDYTTNAYDYGVLTTGYLPNATGISMDLGCYSSDNNTTEKNCGLLGADFLDYGQTIYQTFTTDNFIDAFRFEINSLQNGVGKVGIRLFQGNVKTNPTATPLLGLTPVGSCHVINTTTAWGGFNELCTLLPNTVYSIQLSVHDTVDAKNILTRINHLGTSTTLGANPAALPANNLMGVLASSPSGTTTSASDVFSCNAYLSNNVCGTVNPAAGVTIGSTLYELNTWFTFTIAASSDIIITSPNNTYKRIFTGDVTGNCNLTSFSEFLTATYDSKCFPAGTYSIQILGKVGTGANLMNTSSTQLGSAVDVSIKVTDLTQVNTFNISVLGAVDEINALAPMPDGILIPSTLDQFGCDNTVFPAAQTCGTNQVKASYRNLTIGDANGDGTPDSGVLLVAFGNPRLTGNLYQGDVAALAASQAYPTATITGLTDMIGCVNPYWSGVTCVTPGKYTFATFAEATDVGETDKPSFLFSLITTTYSDPASPYSYGNITASISGGATVSNSDVFDCTDNPQTIAGVTPCYNKLIYREFQITTPLLVDITNAGGLFRLFKGQLSAVGLSGLTVSPEFGTACRTSWNQGFCTTLPAGWYTVVSYGYGGTYAGPTYNGGLIATSNTVSIKALTPALTPAYNDPTAPYVAGTTDYGTNAGTAAIPNFSKTYSFGKEDFGCVPDAPFNPSIGTSCGASFNRVAYYTFTLTNESYLRFSGIANTFRAKLFNFDVATSAALMATATPIQSCLQSVDIPYFCLGVWHGEMEICRAQPGTYTLVILATDAHIGSSISPQLYVDKIQPSQHDFAWKAYEFGVVPGDNVMHYNNSIINDAGLVVGRNASNDFFSCTTGADVNDPDQDLCFIGGFPQGGTKSVTYPIGTNTAVYSGLTTVTSPTRRNLWYTFQVNGPGIVTINVENKTTGKMLQYPFAVYRSDETFTGNFAALKAGGGIVDSTIVLGLTHIETNNTRCGWGGGCKENLMSQSFNITPCSAPTTVRYYIVVDDNILNKLTSQVEVGIQFEALTPVTTVYDWYKKANVINGLNEVTSPYTIVNLGAGIYQGDPATYACTNPDDIVGQVGSCSVSSMNSLWYKFTVASSGKFRVNYQIDGGASRFYTNTEMLVFKEVIPGDSTLPGLEQVTLSSIINGGNPWGEGCMTAGTYYIVLTGCTYDIEAVVPHLWIIEEVGDVCAQAAPLSITGTGTASSTITIDCHGIGGDFGEDISAPNMGCLFGPSNYKSSWFKVALNGANKLDINFAITENTTAFASQIRYRVLYGACSSMTAGPCNTDAGTSFTLNCMQAGGAEYYVQVVSPVTATGTITLTTTATVSTNQSCSSFDPLLPIANFISDASCHGDLVCFTNMSTAGADIAYSWDFGDGATSTAVNPCHTYATSAVTSVFNVNLTVTNTVTSASSTVTVPISIYPQPSGAITIDAPYNGVSVIPGGVNVTFQSNPTGTILSPATTYSWDFGGGYTAATAAGVVNYDLNVITGSVVVEVTITNGTCDFIDNHTITVGFEPIFVGGPYDGENFLFETTLCPQNSVYIGGPYDGENFSDEPSLCLHGNIYAGGPYDGEDFSDEPTLCIHGNIFVGGPYDGEDFLSETALCPQNTIYAGGPYDGEGKISEIALCPQQNIYVGGPYDGEDMGTGNITITSSIPSGIICSGQNVTLTAGLVSGAPTGYNWVIVGTPGVIATTASIVVTPTQTTTYGVSITSAVCANNPSSYEEFTINVTPLIVNAGIDTTACAGASKVLGIPGDIAQTYSWSPIIGLSNPNIAQPTATPTATTTYTLTSSFVSGSCPSATDLMVFTVVANPVITPIADVTLTGCPGASQSVTMAGSNLSTFEWKDASNTILATTAGYTITSTGIISGVAYNGACKDSISIAVTQSPSAIIAGYQYRTKANGNWTNTAIWEIFNGTTWVAASSYTDPCGIAPGYPTSSDLTILVSHTVLYDFTIPSGIDETTIDATGIVTIPTGVEMFLVDVSSSIIAVDLQNNGKLIITGLFTPVGTGLLVNDHNSTVLYNGVAQNLWNGTYGKLEIDGGGIKTVTGTLTAATNDVSFINGHIQLGNRNFTLKTLATTTGASTNTGWFVTNAFGSLYKLDVGSTNILTYQFQVGTSITSYNSINITNNGTTDSYKVRVGASFDFDADYACDALTTNSAINRTWYVAEDIVGGSNLVVHPYWNTVDENVSFNRTRSFVGEYQVGTGWVQIGTVASASTLGTQYYTPSLNSLTPYAYSVGTCSNKRNMYKTIANGVWTDETIWNVRNDILNTWQPTTTAPCTCGPVSYPTSSDSTITVYHEVDFDTYIPVGVDELTIETTGKLKIINQNLLIVDGPTAIDIHNKGDLNVKNPGFTLAPTANLTNTNASTVTYNGTNQTMWAGQYGNLKIDGDGTGIQNNIKTVSGAGTKIMTDIEFKHGVISLGTNDINVDALATITNASTLKGYVNATGTGFFVWDIPIGTLVNRIFPIGGVYFSPASVTFDNVTSLGTLKGQVKEDYFSPVPYSPIKRYWTINQGTVTFTGNYSLALTYDDVDLPSTPISTQDELAMVEIGGAYSLAYTEPNNWRLSSTNTVSYVATVQNNVGVITNSAFSVFTLMRNVLPLPIELLAFEGEIREKDANLYWATLSEINNLGFDLERSTDAFNFETIAFIEGTGDSKTKIDYNFVDDEIYDLGVHIVYYRLKQIDFDGKITYSKTIALPVLNTILENQNKDEIITLYPNPTRAGWEETLLYHLQKDSEINIVVYDIFGRIYHSQYLDLENGRHKITIPTNHLASGTYFVKVTSKRNTSIKKMTVID